MSTGIDAYTTENVAAPAPSGTEGARGREAEGRAIQPVLAYGPQGKVWKAKTANQPVRLTGTTDRFDRQEQPVIPVEPAVEQKAESSMPVLVPCEEEAPLAAPV